MVADNVAMRRRSALSWRKRGRMRQKDAVCREGYRGAGAYEDGGFGDCDVGVREEVG